MKHQTTLIITSLLQIVLFSFHWVDEISRGLEPGVFSAVIGGLLILAVWLYGTLALGDRRSGLIIILLGSILAAGVPVLHSQGMGLVGRRIANTSGIFFWVWNLVALGATGIFSLVLSARTLWSMRQPLTPKGARGPDPT